MTRPIVSFPQSVFQQVQFNWRIAWGGQSAGEFNDGVTGTHYAGFPKWVGSPSTTLDDRTMGAWRAVLAQAQGKTSLYRVRMTDPAVFVRAKVNADRQTLCVGKTTSDGNYFSNGRGWEYDPFALCAAQAKKGATKMLVNVSSCNNVSPVVGQILSANYWPFAVTYVLFLFGSTFEIGVSMPLREAIPENGVVKLRGEGLFELTEGSGGVSYSASRFAGPQMEFTEALKR